MIVYALGATWLGVVLGALLTFLVLRWLYVIGRREQQRRAWAEEPLQALMDKRDDVLHVNLGGGYQWISRERHDQLRARELLRQHDPALAMRLDALDGSGPVEPPA